MVFAKVFILPIVLVLFVSFATLLVFNPIFVGFWKLSLKDLAITHFKIDLIVMKPFSIVLVTGNNCLWDFPVIIVVGIIQIQVLLMC